ncbi:MAG: xanthine dehydrogenase accessory protein XdhC [Paracoccaceae bacterium]
MVTGFDIDMLGLYVRDHGVVVRIVVAQDKGSAPRGAGTAMLVSGDTQFGTIGGGALEHGAVAKARAMLAKDGVWLRRFDKVPLGPALGQCCGGAVSLLFERFGPDELRTLKSLTDVFVRPLKSGNCDMPLPVRAHLRDMRAGRIPAGISAQNDWLIEPLQADHQPLWIYGAGHVGRALVTTLTGLPFTITWIDTARARFPDAIAPHVDMLVAANPADAVKHAPDGAHHLVLTYSHSLDFEICHRVLTRPFAALGVIGSDTKRRRFLKRLKAAGVDPSRLICPIGTPALGKEPMAIAVGVVAELLHNRILKSQKSEARA